MHAAISGTLIGLMVLASTTALAERMTPMERVASTPKGQLKSPYTDFDSVTEEGLKISPGLPNA